MEENLKQFDREAQLKFERKFYGARPQPETDNGHNTEKRKPFNLEAALNGAPVVTRDGSKVTGIRRTENGSVYHIEGSVSGNGVGSFTLHGKYYSTGDPSCLDLFMAPEPETDPGYYEDKLFEVIHEIAAEVKRAKKLHPGDFHNQHEAYAVMLEEVDELWNEIKRKQSDYDLAEQRKEATQVAAMAVRMIVELL